MDLITMMKIAGLGMNVAGMMKGNPPAAPMSGLGDAAGRAMGTSLPDVYNQGGRQQNSLGNITTLAEFMKRDPAQMNNISPNDPLDLFRRGRFGY
mgnify:CR=1 FL=1